MAIGSALLRRHQPDSTDLPTLRWTYCRDGEVLICELALTQDHSAYELRLAPFRTREAHPSELFDDAMSALQRQSQVERTLMRDGWRLDRFENDCVSS